ncbi:hypothetical protein M409DRAFT_53251 [Zasmidium cellare ATCC 36951]|uniref:Uncharacterized protein n=1 Tax=Zasmidium cellare ATCC 36951 TaxID=1080233 RepID=A0A6A6CNH9_ZASCE|nr:uncharacterized protein M409DRAFT_53251 [Zasmidium cellare ATCC 36951]KAF2168601.1 hypothetical protein M409DRAFT_53251 [Zasmidium cellare ATCC 36951]
MFWLTASTGKISLTDGEDGLDTRALSTRANVPGLHCGYTRAALCALNVGGVVAQCIWAAVDSGIDAGADGSRKTEETADVAVTPEDCGFLRPPKPPRSGGKCVGAGGVRGLDEIEPKDGVYKLCGSGCDGDRPASAPWLMQNQQRYVAIQRHEQKLLRKASADPSLQASLTSSPQATITGSVGRSGAAAVTITPHVAKKIHKLRDEPLEVRRSFHWPFTYLQRI